MIHSLVGHASDNTIVIWQLLSKMRIYVCSCLSLVLNGILSRGNRPSVASSGSTDIKAHPRPPHDPKPNTIPHCFTSYSNQLKIFTMGPKPRPWKCNFPDCTQTFRSEARLLEHKTYNSDHDYCQYCDMNFEEWDDLKDHKCELATREIENFRLWDRRETIRVYREGSKEGLCLDEERERDPKPQLKHLCCKFCGQDFLSLAGRDLHIRQVSSQCFNCNCCIQTHSNILAEPPGPAGHHLQMRHQVPERFAVHLSPREWALQVNFGQAVSRLHPAQSHPKGTSS